MTGSGIFTRSALGLALLVCLAGLSGCSGFNLAFQENASWESLIASGDQAYEKGRFEQAADSYELAVELAEDDPLHHNRLSVALNKLGQASLALEEYEQAEKFFTRALETDRELYDGHHTAIGVDLNNLGLLSYHRGDHEEAERFYRDAMTEYASGNDEDRLGRSTAMMNLALVYCDDNRYADAVPLLAKALDIRRQLLGEDHPDVATVQSNLGMAYIGTEEYDEAKRCLKASLAVLKDADTALKLASLYRFLNEEEAADRIARKYGV